MKPTNTLETAMAKALDSIGIDSKYSNEEIAHMLYRLSFLIYNEIVRIIIKGGEQSQAYERAIEEWKNEFNL